MFISHAWITLILITKLNAILSKEIIKLVSWYNKMKFVVREDIIKSMRYIVVGMHFPL